VIKRYLISLLVLISIFTLQTLDQTATGDERSRTIDSLTTRIEEDIHDTDRINTLNELAWNLMYANPDTAIFLSSEALSLSELHEWQLGIAKSIGRLGTFYWLKGDYPRALDFFFKALKINKELGSKYGIAINLGNIGLVYANQGDYTKALEYFFKALKMDEELGNNKDIATDLGNIGLLYNYQNNHPKALEFYFKALSMDEELGNKNGIGRHLGNIGNVYMGQKNYPKAKEYYEKSLVINEEQSNKNGMAVNLGNIGIVYRNQGDSTVASYRGGHSLSPADISGAQTKAEAYYEKALEYSFKALKMNEDLGKKSSIAINLGNIGALYTDIGEFEKANVNLQKALFLSKEMGDKERLKDHYRNLSILYDTTGRPAQAFEAYKLYIIYRDSMDNEENTKAQMRTEMKYEYEKAELVRQQEEKEKARIEAEVTGRRDNLQYSVILIAILVLFGGVLSLGFVKVSPRMAEGIIFFSFLILFEFLLVLADPYIEGWSEGAPGIKLLFNAGIAALIFPAHAFFETKMKGRLVK